MSGLGEPGFKHSGIVLAVRGFCWQIPPIAGRNSCSLVVVYENRKNSC